MTKRIKFLTKFAVSVCSVITKTKGVSTLIVKETEVLKSKNIHLMAP
jgi:intein-encoded DNA endonuclease-like protein